MRTAWERVEAKLPEPLVKSKISPPRPKSRSNITKTKEVKLSKEKEDAMATRLSTIKKASKYGDKYLLQSENTNCTFEPDIVTARTSMDADKAAMDHRKEGEMLKYIKRSILPSVASSTELTGRNARAEINKLVANKSQVKYWGLSETELLQLTMAKSKVAHLYGLLQVKDFVGRNAGVTNER